MPSIRKAARRIVALAALALACCTSLPAIDPLPGAAPFDDATRRELARALAARGAEYRPRTRHLRADGSPSYTNRLLLDPSPYLLQHAHNPVDWQPWGDAAFARALAESKPVLLSVGYSTCHWCHVMEEESFEDEEIAAYLNANYVCIKVDREVRPDLDEAYMIAVQTLTGSGGWPMTVWLTPGRQPFYGGTYFPARDGDRGARVGLLSLLRQLKGVFDAEPLKVASQADAITRQIQTAAAPPPGDARPDAALLHAAFARFAASFDAEQGGFGRAPKFPTPPALDFLLRYHRHAGNAEALEMVVRTLDRMAAGGIRDHVGGGFHRYATDRSWQLPHFEKMLYDNAQLALVYLAAAQATGRDDFRTTVREILDYLGREMAAPEGGFFAATDADSEGEEGRFFVWTPGEIRGTLDPAHADAVLAYYGVTAGGNFHGRTVLHVERPVGEVALEQGMQSERLREILAEARPALRAVRARRIPPHTDTKVLTAWNGLAVSAFARAGAVLGERAYVGRAETTARFLLEHVRAGDRLQRAFAAGHAHEDAFLDDYAFLIAGLLDLWEATSDPSWLRHALALQTVLDRSFWDAEAGAYFLTAADREVALARQKPDADGALPSGNAVAAMNLLRLAEIAEDDRLRERADGLFRALAASMTRTPTGAPALLSALDFRLDAPKAIVIVHPAGAGAEAAPLLAEVHATYLPNRVLAVVGEGDDLERQQALLPLVEGKRALGGRATAYVCERRVCSLPTSDATVLGRQLATVRALAPS
jgi:uncharacterized protein YyaL (SSP411 family)